MNSADLVRVWRSKGRAKKLGLLVITSSFIGWAEADLQHHGPSELEILFVFGSLLGSPWAIEETSYLVNGSNGSHGGSDAASEIQAKSQNANQSASAAAMLNSALAVLI